MAKDSTPPATFHYDRWLGPAPMRPYNEKRSHYNWHWYWDTGNGDTGNTGPHTLDLARWGMNKNEHPISAYSVGGIYGFRKDDNHTPGVMVYGDVEAYGSDKTTQETPNTQTCAYKYSDGKILELETRGWYTNNEGYKGVEVGNTYYGTEGYLEISGDTWKAFRKREKEPFAGPGIGERKNLRGPSHWANFIDAVRSGKNEDLHCSMLEGHMSSALPHLANISYRLGREVKFNGSTEKFVSDPEADKMLARVEYRKPYIVPDKV
jgi:predicted dehydrogenase